MNEKSQHAKRVYIQTYGCQMNEADSEKMISLLRAQGYELTSDERQANLILINTCTVRDGAEHRAFGRIGEFKALKEKNPGVILGVCGCVASQHKDALKKKFPWIDIVVDTGNIGNISMFVEQAEKKRALHYTNFYPQEHRNIDDVSLPFSPLRVTPKPSSKLSSFVTVIHGCNYACTFCIVPFVRGKEISREEEDIVSEVRGKVENGTKEVTLLGQNILAYGRDLDAFHVESAPKGTRNPFVKLLYAVHSVEGLRRVRFVTSHPRDMKDDVIDAMAALPKVCEYIHIPAQAGDDTTLRRMGRSYTTAYYRGLVSKIRNIMPDAAVSTDLIVGFPGETDEEFENTLNFAREIRWDSAYTFMYSVRTGTRAAAMEQVPQEIKKERLNRLIEAQREICLEKNKALVRTVQDVLVEGEDEKKTGKLTGRTRTNRIVLFEGNASLAGKVVPVEITEAKPFTLYGKVNSVFVNG